MKTEITFILLFLAISINTYPLYKQCDNRWRNDLMGNSGRTLCQDGCAISSVAMALTGIGNTYTPKTLNQYYTNNNYYVNGNLIDWTKVNGLGLIY